MISIHVLYFFNPKFRFFVKVIDFLQEILFQVEYLLVVILILFFPYVTHLCYYFPKNRLISFFKFKHYLLEWIVQKLSILLIKCQSIVLVQISILLRYNLILSQIIHTFLTFNALMKFVVCIYFIWYHWHIVSFSKISFIHSFYWIV